jgi:hypothetical protein
MEGVSLMKKNPPLIVAGIIFTIIALLHLCRLICDISVMVGSTMLPEWVSWAGLIIPALLAIWMFKAAKKGRG